MILAPLRGVTVRRFRRTFADAIREAGFTEAVTPFITANAGVDPIKDRELRRDREGGAEPFAVTPQFIGKDPAAFGECLRRIRDAGYATADLNCGCPFPMVRNKGRGSGLLRTPDVLARMLEAGCEVMGPGALSVKARLGVDHADELLRLMPILNGFPLRFLAVHARTARQMYDGKCDDKTHKMHKMRKRKVQRASTKHSQDPREQQQSVSLSIRSVSRLTLKPILTACFQNQF